MNNFAIGSEAVINCTEFLIHAFEIMRKRLRIGTWKRFGSDLGYEAKVHEFSSVFDVLCRSYSSSLGSEVRIVSKKVRAKILTKTLKHC